MASSSITNNPLEGDELYPLIVLYTLSQGYLPHTSSSSASVLTSSSSSAISSVSTTTNTALSTVMSTPNSIPTNTITEEPNEDPATHNKLLQLLTNYKDKNLINFSTLTHAPTKTSEDSAKVRGVSLDSGAKAMLLRSGKPIKIDNNLVSLSSTITPSINSTNTITIPTFTTPNPYILIILAASKQADLNKIKKLLGTKDLRMASVDEVKAVTGCIPGAVPPFGSLWKTLDTQEYIPTIIDKSIINQGPTINFNAGLRTFSVINLSVLHYLSVENPLISEFSK